MDYYSVDPDLGDWENIETLGRHFDLMFDAVFNHASAQGVWFEKFLRQEARLGDRRSTRSPTIRIFPRWCVRARSRC